MGDIISHLRQFHFLSYLKLFVFNFIIYHNINIRIGEMIANKTNIPQLSNKNVVSNYKKNNVRSSTIRIFFFKRVRIFRKYL